MTRVVLTALALLAVPLGQAQLRDAQPVYFWPMQHAFDQYLAEAVNGADALSVTVDPKRASSMMTERIDATFLAALEELFPEQKPAKDEDDKDVKSKESIEGRFQLARPKNRPQGRPQGTLFLVDVKTRRVIWSTYMGEVDPEPKALHKEAERVVEDITALMGPAT
ncbi:MAG: hypothetical protein GC160_09500 [Acidobacteria bacterium]|nr:hypothetical protein [Acidobacteriota bacterium]